MDQEARELVYNGLKTSTHMTYSSAQRQFQQFCIGHNLVPVPATEDTLLFLAQLHRQKCRYATVNVYLSAIRSLHIMHGCDDTMPQYLRLKLATRAVGLACESTKQKQQLALELLEKIQACRTGCCNHKMLWAVTIIKYKY